ncbi:hypothetical protein KSS87_013014 [Heliosperma pusillum]|nr:hypothetical protein KSS87_013014 [Heliosperma pusillum]
MPEIVAKIAQKLKILYAFLAALTNSNTNLHFN